MGDDNAFLTLRRVLAVILTDDAVSAGTGQAKGDAARGVLLEQLVDLLDRPLYTMSGPNLDDLLQLIEVLVTPLAHLKEVRSSFMRGNKVFFCMQNPDCCAGTVKQLAKGHVCEHKATVRSCRCLPFSPPFPFNV